MTVSDFAAAGKGAQEVKTEGGTSHHVSDRHWDWRWRGAIARVGRPASVPASYRQADVRVPLRQATLRGELPQVFQRDLELVRQRRLNRERLPSRRMSQRQRRRVQRQSVDQRLLVFPSLVTALQV